MTHISLKWRFDGDINIVSELCHDGIVPTFCFSRREPGDWPCSQCNEINFKSRNACRKCAKPRTATNNATAAAPKPGDWTCEQCRELNFASRAACFKCGAAKSANPQATPKPGDWICRSCQNLNFASRTVCHRCGVAANVNPTATNHPPPAPAVVTAKPGDWKCSSCPEMNFGSRLVCRSCGAGRPGPPSQTPTENKSECVICMENPINSVIASCGHSALCLECGSRVTQCPICRTGFNQQQLIKVFNVH